jgi:hypothetical protein
VLKEIAIPFPTGKKLKLRRFFFEGFFTLYPGQGIGTTRTVEYSLLNTVGPGLIQ